MKVKVNIINTQCILMSETLTVPGLMMMTSNVSKESHTDIHTCANGLIYVNFFKVLRLKTKVKEMEIRKENRPKAEKEDRRDNRTSQNNKRADRNA